MTGFDYIFYRVSNFYKKKDDDTFSIYGIGFVSLLQLVLLILIFLLLAFAFKDLNQLLFEEHEGKNYLSSPITIIVLIILGLNGFRYTRIKTFEHLEKLWKNENVMQKQKRKSIIIYITVFSIAVTLILSIYRRYYM